MTISIDEFRAGMRRLVGGVTIITVKDSAGTRFGLTATAVASVTDNPPTLLVCVNKRTASATPIAELKCFGVNVLNSSQQDLSARFGSKLVGEDRFAVGDWAAGVTGSPILRSALAAFDCRVSQMVDASTHLVFFGEIQTVSLNDSNTNPLLYGFGSYGTLTAATV